MDAAMLSAKFLVVFILLFIFQDGAKSKRTTRRRASCQQQDCVVSAWSMWSACTAIKCSSWGTQTRTRVKIIAEKCRGQCRKILRDKRFCRRGPVNCEFSSWSEWSTCDGTVCTGGHGTQVVFRNIKCEGTCTWTSHMTRSCFNSMTRKARECQVGPWSQWGNCTRSSCQLSGFQARTRKKTVKEECKGTCKDALHDTTSCAKPELPCFNGGKYKPNITGCVCMQGYSGVCCEKSPQGLYD